MWKSIPSLINLHEEIVSYLSSIIEKGGENDYVTIDYLVNRYKTTHPVSARSHHIDQIINAIKSHMNGPVVTILISTPAINDDPPICFNCGKEDQAGYRGAYRFYKLCDEKKCPYNYGCGCDCDYS